MDAIIKTERITLRPFDLSDAPAFRAIKADPAVARMTASFQSGYDLLSAQGFIEIAQARTALGHAFDWAITAGGEFVGSLGLFRTGGDWEIGYALDRMVWGRGLATEAVRAATNAFCDTFPGKSLLASVFTDNPASRSVLLRTGFVQDDKVRSGYSLARLGRCPMWMFSYPARCAAQANYQSTSRSATPLAALTESA